MEAEQLAGGVAAAASDRLEALGELLTERLPSAVKGAAASLRDKLSSASEELPKALREAPRATLLPDTLIATALTLALLGFALQSRAACSFQAAGAPGGGLLLCRQTMAGHAEVQTALARVTQRSGWLWRRRQVDHFVLLGGGWPNSLLRGPHVGQLAKAVSRAVAPSGRLELIVLTHGRGAGALPALLQAHPAALVAAHTDLLPALTAAGVPSDRLLELRGESGDVADGAKAAGKSAKRALSWLKRGTMLFTATGHAPGALAVAHTPSAALLPGDAVIPVATGLFGGKSLTLGVQPHMLAADAARAKAAAKHLIEEASGGAASGLSWQWLLPSHGGNFSRSQAEELVQGWAPPRRHDKQHAPSAATASHAAAGHGGAATFLEAHDAAAAGLGLSPGKVPAGGSADHEGGGSAGAVASRSEL